MKTKFTLITVIIIIMAMFNTFGQAQNTNSKVKKDNFNKKTLNASSLNKDILLNDYTFSVSTGTYSNLTGSTPINNDEGSLWDDPECEVPIGFSFQFYNTSINSIYFDFDDGGLLIDSNGNEIYVFDTDIEDRGNISGTPQSPITYKSEGTTGSRIFKLEWKNAGFYDEQDSLNTLNDYINFQLWLYEGSNKIEMHYGANLITNPGIDYWGETGASVGLIDNNGNSPYILSGNPANPTLNASMYLNGTPLNGTIYTFTKNGSGINEQNDFSTQIFPNPVSNNLVINTKNNNVVNFKIINYLGQTLIEDKISNQHNVINMSSLTKGVYFLHLETLDHKVITKKLIKQ